MRNNKPGAWICVSHANQNNRGRTKTFAKNPKQVYLKNNQEFEIELYNPTKDNVLAKIEIDGKSVSRGGLVIKRGQRVYLECFPDTKKKFTFSTYEVKNTKSNREAIDNNGKVNVSFYKERVPKQYWYTTTIPYWPNCYDWTIFNTNNTGTGNLPTYGSTTRGIVDSGCNTLNSMSFDSCVAGDTSVTTSNLVGDGVSGATSDFFDSGIDTSQRSSVNKLRKRSMSKSLETGQVEGGDHSNQNFEYVDMRFESWTLSSYEYQILPESRKPASPNQFKNETKVSSNVSKIDQLYKLKDLLDSNLISMDEFESMKADLI